MTDKTNAPESGAFCPTCGAPNILRFTIPAQTAAEAEIQRKLTRMQAEIERDFGARMIAAAFDKENLPNAKREPTVGELAARIEEVAKASAEPNHLFRLAAFHTRLERIEAEQKWCVEHIKTLEARQQSWSEITTEMGRIGTRQFETGRLLGIVSESCATARNEARRARWIAFLCAVVLLGLLCGLVIGKVA
jgi:hypothetical protein